MRAPDSPLTVDSDSLCTEYFGLRLRQYKRYAGTPSILPRRTNPPPLAAVYTYPASYADGAVADPRTLTLMAAAARPPATGTSAFTPASLGLPPDFKLTNYSKLKG